MKGLMKKPLETRHSPISVSELSRILGCPYEGDGSLIIKGVSSLEKASPGDLVFLSHSKYRHLLEKTKASAAVIPLKESYHRISVIKSENPHLSFIQAIDFFYTPYQPEPGRHPQAFISPSARIGKNVSIGAFAFIGDAVEIGEGSVIFPLVSIYPRVKIGKNTIIHSHVSIREDVLIGNHVIIHNGSVIGSDGFGYIQDKDGSRIKIPQKGTVVIQDNVEIGANATVDRAVLDETIIARGTKIDNLVHIAHSVEIGENNILAAQTGIAGSSKTGRNVIMAGQVGVADHVTIGDDVIIAAKSGIAKDVPAKSFIGGIPSLDIKEWRKFWISAPHLYGLLREVKKLKKKIEAMEKKK